MKRAIQIHSAALEPEVVLDDEPLVRAVAEGDISALGVLYDRHSVAVRQFLRRIGLDGAEADDVAQDVFLWLRSCAARFDGGEARRGHSSSASPPGARCALGIGVRRWARALVLAPATAPVERPDEALQRADEHRLFETALAKLSDRKRVVFIMIEREGMSSAEVAEAIGVPIGTVWTRLFHARSELARRLTRGGGG